MGDAVIISLPEAKHKQSLDLFYDVDLGTANTFIKFEEGNHQLKIASHSKTQKPGLYLIEVFVWDVRGEKAVMPLFLTIEVQAVEILEEKVDMVFEVPK